MFSFFSPFNGGAVLARRVCVVLALLGLPLLAQAQLTVSSVAPARNLHNAARPANVVLTFTQALNAATAGNVRVFSAQRGGQLVRGGNATASGSTLTVDPANDRLPQRMTRSGASEYSFWWLPASLPGRFLPGNGQAFCCRKRGGIRPI